jgi:hypothetical protein
MTGISDQRVLPATRFSVLCALPNEHQRLSQGVSITHKSDQPPLPNLNIRTPPLPPFDWWKAHASHSVASASAATSVAIPKSDLPVKLLRDFPRTIINYEDEHIYTNMVKSALYIVRSFLDHYLVCDVEFDMSDIFLA